MHIMFTKMRRTISEWQGIIGVLLISTALVTHTFPKSFGIWTDTIFVSCMLALAIVVLLGSVTVRKRGQYLELAKQSTETFGGQQFVDATLRRLAVRSMRPVHRLHDHPYDALTRFFSRLGYHVDRAGLPAYLPR